MIIRLILVGYPEGIPHTHMFVRSYLSLVTRVGRVLVPHNEDEDSPIAALLSMLNIDVSAMAEAVLPI